MFQNISFCLDYAERQTSNSGMQLKFRHMFCRSAIMSKASSKFHQGTRWSSRHAFPQVRNFIFVAHHTGNVQMGPMRSCDELSEECSRSTRTSRSTAERISTGIFNQNNWYQCCGESILRRMTKMEENRRFMHVVKMGIRLVWDKKIQILLQWNSTIIQLLMILVLYSRQKQEPLPLTETTEIHTGYICRCCWGLPAGCQSPVWCSAGTEASATLCHLSQYQPVQMQTCTHTHTDRVFVSPRGERDQGDCANWADWAPCAAVPRASQSLKKLHMLLSQEQHPLPLEEEKHLNRRVSFTWTITACDLECFTYQVDSLNLKN